MNAHTEAENIALQNENTSLCEELKHERAVNRHLDDYLDKIIIERDGVRNILREVSTGKISKSTGMDYIMLVTGWRR